MGQKNTAIALGILVSRASCLTIPEFSVRRLTTWRAVVTEGAALPLVYHPTASKKVAMLPRDFCGRCAMKQYRGPLTSDVRPLRIPSRTVSTGGGGGVVCRSAVQSMTFRQNTEAPYMKVAIPGEITAVAPPVGGYPPPENLHGVFAVIKPKGFSSSDAVQKIKNVLTKGVREELRARLASENGTAERHAEHDPNADSGSEISSREETKGKRLNDNRPRRRQGPKVKVGHGGTLDPMATGVLVIGVGRGCRELSNYLKGGKAYRVEALLGHETDTQDAEGEPTLHGEWGHVTNGVIDSVLGQFTGDIMQVPPMFSALRRDGQRLYQLARQGITVEREARPVRVHSLRQTEPTLPLPRFGLEVECGGGFYVRTLVEDLGRAIGTRAHMTALERTKQGPFELEHALALENWGYDELCAHLKETIERLGRCDMSAEEEALSNGAVVVATAPNAAAAAGK